MFRRLRATLTLGLCVSICALSVAAPAHAVRPAAPVLQIEVLRVHPAAAAPDRAKTAAVPGSCADRTYNLAGARWDSTYRWYFRARSTPGILTRDGAEAAIRRGVGNIVNARNDCGRADNVAAQASYLGRTTVAPSCIRTDGRNVIGFRSLSDAGVAARACWWMSGSRIVEADVQLNADLAWATSLVGCFNRLMLEAVTTHETGHVFGLGHVGERAHGRLTMSPFLDGACNNHESTLGLGDMRGLEALYP